MKIDIRSLLVIVVLVLAASACSSDGGTPAELPFADDDSVEEPADIIEVESPVEEEAPATTVDPVDTTVAPAADAIVEAPVADSDPAEIACYAQVFVDEPIVDVSDVAQRAGELSYEDQALLASCLDAGE